METVNEETINSRLSYENNRLKEENTSLVEQLKQVEQSALLWQRRAREVLDILHAFSSPITNLIQRAWQAGL